MNYTYVFYSARPACGIVIISHTTNHIGDIFRVLDYLRYSSCWAAFEEPIRLGY